MARPATPELSAGDWVEAVHAALEPLRDPTVAVSMRAYMKDVAPFLGIPAPVQRAAVKSLGRPADHELVTGAKALFALPEREYHYVAVDALVARARHLPPSGLDDLAWFIHATPWWDTVDALAKAVGAQVWAHPQHVTRMDEWVRSNHLWTARAAILHQLGFRERTDVERLFRLCLVRAHEKEFFFRKAIGWALRDYAWTDPVAIRDFVGAHRAALSALTIREATKNLPKLLA